MEQIVRDTQIAKLYEGTTGVQALDLLGRKVLLGKLKTFRQFHAEVKAFTHSHENPKALKPLVRTLKQYMRKWHISTLRIAFSARRNPDLVGSASVDYLMFSGYVVMAYFWAKMADAAYTQIARGGEVEFHQAKVQTAQFYFDRMLPRAKAHAEMMLKKPETLMQLKEESFAFQ